MLVPYSALTNVITLWTRRVSADFLPSSYIYAVYEYIWVYIYGIYECIYGGRRPTFCRPPIHTHTEREREREGERERERERHRQTHTQTHAYIYHTMYVCIYTIHYIYIWYCIYTHTRTQTYTHIYPKFKRSLEENDFSSCVWTSIMCIVVGLFCL